MSIFIVIVILCGVCFAIMQGVKLKAQQDAENNTFAGEHRGWDIYLAPYDRCVVALNHDSKQIVVGRVTDHRQLPFSQISAVEIERNGQSLTQTNRGSQVMGAAVGAVLLGPLGLLMGGLTGSKRNKQRVSELALKIIVDDPRAPVHRVVFFRMKGDGVDAKSGLLREPAKKLEHFHALISNAIRSDQRSAAQQSLAPSPVNESTENRIAKLWELKQAGALSAEEFTSRKLALLSNAQGMNLAKSK